MIVTVKYLASLAEAIEKTEETVTLESPTSVFLIWESLNPNTPMLANTICAIDHQYASPDDIISDHCELAFFPPVTGG